MNSWFKRHSSLRHAPFVETCASVPFRLGLPLSPNMLILLEKELCLRGDWEETDLLLEMEVEDWSRKYRASAWHETTD
jgi:hypothetical protein